MEQLTELLLYWSQWYLAIGVLYVILVSFLKGLVEKTFVAKDILKGLFFPFEIANELGYVVKILIQYITRYNNNKNEGEK